MSGKIVPGSGSNIYLKTAPASAANAIFEVFGTPTGGKLSGLVNALYDPQDATIRFTACNAPALPLSMRSFAGYAKYATSPTIGVTNLSATTLIPNFSGGGGTTYYAAIGTSVGGTESMAWTALADGTSALTLASSLTVGSTYYVSGYSSNANGTRTLAVSNTTALVIPTAPTITANTISNTTFTATAAIPANATSNVYSLYTQAGVFQSSNTTGTFTGLTTNTRYYVSVFSATTYTKSASTNSASVWCLSPVTFGEITLRHTDLYIIVNWTNTHSTPGTTVTQRYTITNANGTATSGDIEPRANVNIRAYLGLGSAPTWDSPTAAFIVDSTFSTLTIAINAPNSSYTNPTLKFQRTVQNYMLSITPPSNVTMYYVAKGGNGGPSRYLNNSVFNKGGIGARVDKSVSVSAGSVFKIYTGQNGLQSDTIGTIGSRAASGDGTWGGGGGAAYYTGSYGSGNGGQAGGGGAATIVTLSGAPLVICGGGGGTGQGGNNASGQWATGGNGGVGTVAANGYTPGGEGDAQATFSNAFGHQGGWGGSQTISNRAGDWASPDPTTGYTAGAGGGGYRGTVNYVTNFAYGSNGGSWNNTSTGAGGGDGVSYAGTNSGGGGGGYGGGGSGTATNQGSTGIAGGGGGGGSWASTASTFYNPGLGDGWTYGFAYYF